MFLVAFFAIELAILTTSDLEREGELVALAANILCLIVIVTVVWFLLYKVKKHLESAWSNWCNQLLAILKHDGGSNWDKLSFNEQNILHEYISKECSRMQKIKLGKMTYNDVLAIKSNLDYLQSIDYVNEMPDVYGLNTRVQSFKGFYTTNDFKNVSRGVNNARETKK